MSNLYRVKIEQRCEYEIEVVAESEEEARDLVWESHEWREAKWVDSSSDIEDVELLEEDYNEGDVRNE